LKQKKKTSAVEVIKFQEGNPCAPNVQLPVGKPWGTQTNSQKKPGISPQKSTKYGCSGRGVKTCHLAAKTGETQKALGKKLVGQKKGGGSKNQKGKNLTKRGKSSQPGQVEGLPQRTWEKKIVGKKKKKKAKVKKKSDGERRPWGLSRKIWTDQNYRK